MRVTSLVALVALVTPVSSGKSYTARNGSQGNVDTSLEACPEAACSGDGRNTSSTFADWSTWTAVDSLERLASCKDRVLVDCHYESGSEIIRACRMTESVSSPLSGPRALLAPSRLFSRQLSRRGSTASGLCNADATSAVAQLSISKAGDGSDLTFATADALALVGRYLSQNSSCEVQRTYSYGQGPVVGVYSGSAIDNAGTAGAILTASIAVANDSVTGSPGAFFVQRCTSESTAAGHTTSSAAGSETAQNTFGVAVNTGGNLTWAKYAVEAWAAGACLNQSSFASLSLAGGSSINSTTVAGITVWEYSHPPVTLQNLTDPGRNTSSVHPSSSSSKLPKPSVSSKPSSSSKQSVSPIPSLTSPASSSTSSVAAGGDEPETRLDSHSNCTDSTVTSGDSCSSRTKCGITPARFAQFNSSTDLCSALTDGAPKENNDGTCYAYLVKGGDRCYDLAKKYSLTVDKIEAFNKGTTWGWSGCQGLQKNVSICLSPGKPPLPNPVTGAKCGPLVPGTRMPTNGTSLAALNPCPLNACCDKWGQCGITPEYCTNHTGPTGNPGTSPAGENGCISNCGTDITNNKFPPAEFIRVGYYESWNYDRPCLNMRVSEIDTTQYTHVHWAFAGIDDNLKIVINDTYKQWNSFKALDAKRIVSLGGWGYSTDASTYDKLRNAMSANNHNYLKFAENIIHFLNDEGLDGVDFDWEYPGAPDIPGVPPGLESDGPNYFAFLGALRGRLGLDTKKTISFAAPASFWYLQHFPIKAMAGEADYVVYMTYDLHGQWDAGNVWAQEGCPGGNCLRSHVNLTETIYTLAMITKAGVPANLITVGVSSYGRSFGMADPACTGPHCLYTGSYGDSTAQPGTCTQVAGYIGNAEIFGYAYANQTITKSWYDSKTDSDYAVYTNNGGSGSTWVAYMSDEVKNSRISRYQGLNFAGTVDWALDLAKRGDFDRNPGNGTDDDDDGTCIDTPDVSNFEICDVTVDDKQCDGGPGTRTLDDLTDDEIGSWQSQCTGPYMLQSLSNLLDKARSNFTELMKNGYDDKFKVYAKALSDSALSQVHDFMQHHGNDYFTCDISELKMCCSECRSNSRGGSYCDYCFPEDGNNPCYVKSRGRRDQDDDIHPSRNKVLNVRWANESEPCPPDFSKRGYGPDNPYEQTVYWKLRDGKADAFYADLLDATGIPKTKIGFGLYTDIDSCGGTGHSPGDGAECWNTGYEFGAPFPNGYGVADVTNPKSIAQSGLSKSADLPGQISDALLTIATDSFLGSEFDLVDAVSLPILMIVQGVESMYTVVQTAEKIEEEQRKAIILAFLSAILFFIPVVGEVAGSLAEIGTIVAIIDALGVAGNAALDIYTVVSDPHNAPLAIISLVLAPVALADVAVVARAARIQRTMKAEDLAKLGDRVGARMNKIKKVTGECKA